MNPRTTHAAGSAPSSLSLAAAAFSLTAAGQALAATSLATWGPPGGDVAGGPPPWFFGIAWTVLYPCLGVSSVLAWRSPRPMARARARWAGLWAITAAMAWMPLACGLGNPWAPVVLDLIGLFAFLHARSAYGRASPKAARWLWPVVVWMPVTLTLSSISAFGSLSAR